MPASLPLLTRNFLQNANGREVTRVTAGVADETPFDVRGASMFTASVKNIGGNVYRIDGRLAGGDWDVVPVTIDANQLYTFTGIYDDLRVVKVSGSGTTAALTIRYGR